MVLALVVSYMSKTIFYYYLKIINIWGEMKIWEGDDVDVFS